jgi:hypothetical protein
VYVPSKDTYYQTLDQHADTLEGDIKPPLVLLGNEGSGKSALLANWVAQRRVHLHRDEFLFQHFVGCTTPSLQVCDHILKYVENFLKYIPALQLSHTLLRLEGSLKEFFQLREMKVPDTEEELRWSLNRFLAAAAKKHFPARIVIIIDGVNRLKADGAPDGSLHWLPTELPPCVRFILSSVEFERVTKGVKEIPMHRTFIELSRRQCPILRMEPLGVETRHRVISSFTSMHDGSIELTEGQLYKVVTANATSQPMFLRALLQALRIASRLTSFSIDQLLDVLLLCQAAVDLVDKNLNLCCDAIFGPKGGDDKVNSEREVLGKIFSVVYVSRNGLTRAEIWGLIRMVTKFEIEPAVEDKVMSVLAEFTMIVNEMYSFSHEVYRELVYDKYIRSHESLIRWHHYMARYFDQLPPCACKLVALPYHLEVAGSWSKVKNCLTDIENFQLWWTPPFKSDFINFWVSLTKQMDPDDEDNNGGGNNESSNPNSRRGRSRKHGHENGTTGNGGDNNELSKKLATRPSYDIVEEYVKSLDEYRAAKEPSDEQIANIILEIGEFLLEFATLGHERAADVPNLIHPKILSSDLLSMGVPHITEDEEGRSFLVQPKIFNKATTGGDDNNNATGAMNMNNLNLMGDTNNATTKAFDDIPEVTNYFFSRWLWIQFPYIALGNCNDRYGIGIQKKNQENSTVVDDRSRRAAGTSGNAAAATTTNSNKGNTNNFNNTQNTEATNGGNMLRTASAGTLLRSANKINFGAVEPVAENAMSKSWNVDNMKLPELKFTRKAARSVRKLTPFDLVDESKANADKFNARLIALQDDIQCYREEYDFVSQMKGGLNKRLADLKGELEDLKRAGESAVIHHEALAKTVEEEVEATKRAATGVTMVKNLNALVKMCNRHPANVPALILEIENKVKQDEFITAEIKKRLWEQRFEKQAHKSQFREMVNLAKEGADMHYKLLDYRYQIKKQLAKQAAENQKKLQLGAASNRDSRASKRDKNKTIGENDKDLFNGTTNEGENAWLVKQGQSWQEMWNIISTRTGITEPEIFFQRLNNSGALEEQISSLTKASEARLDSLKKEVLVLEAELEQARYDASVNIGNSSKEQKKELMKKQSELRHTKERSEASQQLVQNLQSGLAHIAEALGIGFREEDSPVVDLVHDIDAVLETLMEEREKQQQQQQQQLHGHSQSQSESASRVHTSNARDAAAVSSLINVVLSGDLKVLYLLQNMEGTHALRSPELENVLAKFEVPKARLPAQLPSRPTESYVDELTTGTMNGTNTLGGTGANAANNASLHLFPQTSRGNNNNHTNSGNPVLDNDDEEIEDGMWNRDYVKRESVQRIREQKKRAARQSKLASDEA